MGLTGIVAEAQALSNPIANPTLGWLMGMPVAEGKWATVQTAQQTLLPLAIILLVLALGAYLHSVHRQIAGLALLVASSATTVVAVGVAVFDAPFTEILFVPSLLVGLTAVLAALAAVSALAQGPWPRLLPPMKPRRVPSSQLS